VSTTEKITGSILLVDHSRGSLAFQETILRRRVGVQVATAVAGSEGLKRAKSDLPQLIIFAFDLFDMTAPEFCREIREDEDTRGISLLLVCDRESPEHGELCLSAGCNHVIYRPLQRHEFDSKVERLTAIPVRRQLRTITKIEVSMEKNGRFVLGRSVNISATGMLLEVDRVLPGDEPVRLHFYLPGDAKPLQIQADILRAEFSGVTARYGLRFTNSSPEERERIEHFVHRLRSRELI
jgi:response regulator RpfG family c-di-GMP phosphodiesterase